VRSKRSPEARETTPIASRIATPAWRRARSAEVAALRRSRENDPSATTTLLIVAAQHPLVNGRTPGPEFEKRLEAAAADYRQITEAHGKAEFFLPGNRHADDKVGPPDSVALYDAAGLWLVDQGIPTAVLHGKDWIDAYRPQGIYSGAEEISTSSDGFKANPRFRNAIYYCSPAQESRARMFALANGQPLTTHVPDSLIQDGIEQFHGNVVEKIVLNGLVQTIDPDGHGTLSHLTRNRIPTDGMGTRPDLLPQYQNLPWYAEDTSQ